MKKTLLAATAAFALMAPTANAQSIGVTMALFDDNFLTVLRNALAKTTVAPGLAGGRPA